MTDMFYVYVLHSIADKGFYIGFTADFKRRVSEHKKGASFATSYRGPWRLVYYEAYTGRLDAEGRERVSKERCRKALTSESTQVLPRKVSTAISRVRPKAFYAGCLVRSRAA